MKVAKVLAVTVLAGTLSIGIALYGERLFQRQDGSGPVAPTPDGDDEYTTLPDIRLPDLSGREAGTPGWAGRVVVLHYWASWCAPCQRDMALLAARQQALGPGPLQVVGIAIDDPAEVADFVAAQDPGFPILLGDQAALDTARRLGNRTEALPFTVIFDAQGRRVYSRTGELGEARLHEHLDPLLVAGGQ